MFDLDKLAEGNWVTEVSHPWSGIKYQTADSNFGQVARVTQSGYEVVSPSADLEEVYKQYKGRIAWYMDPKKS